MKAPFAGLLAGLAFCIFSSAAIGEAPSFKILKLDGNAVQWRGTVAKKMVTYALVEQDTTFERARNCRKMTRLDGLMSASQDCARDRASRDRGRVRHVGDGGQHPLPRGSKPGAGRHPDRRAARARGLGLRRCVLRRKLARASEADLAVAHLPQPGARLEDRLRRRPAALRYPLHARPTRSATPSASTIRRAPARSWATATRRLSASCRRETSPAPSSSTASADPRRSSPNPTTSGRKCAAHLAGTPLRQALGHARVQGRLRGRLRAADESIARRLLKIASRRTRSRFRIRARSCTRFFRVPETSRCRERYPWEYENESGPCETAGRARGRGRSREPFFFLSSRRWRGAAARGGRGCRRTRPG